METYGDLLGSMGTCANLCTPVGSKRDLSGPTGTHRYLWGPIGTAYLGLNNMGAKYDVTHRHPENVSPQTRLRVPVCKGTHK